MQSVCLLQPHAALKSFVRDYAFSTHEIEAWTKDYVWKLPALREHTLQIFLDEIPTLFLPSSGRSFTVNRCNIFGLVDHSFLDSHMPAFCTRVQISFKPTGFYHLTGIPATHFINSLTDASLVWGKEAIFLTEKLQEKPDHFSRSRVIDDFLLSRIKTFSKKKHLAEIEHVALQILHNPRLHNISNFARLCYKSTRQFERRFKEHTGIAPKKFLCINRFAYANLLKYRKPQKSWLDVAVECGYYDLTHLGKDFKYYGRSTINGFDSYGYEQGIVVPKQ